MLSAMESDKTAPGMAGPHPTIAELRDPHEAHVFDHLTGCSMCRSVVAAEADDVPIPLDLPKGLVSENALRELIKKNQFQVAPSLVERAVELQYQRLRQMLGMKPERGTQGLSDDLRDKMRPAGADEVRGQLLLEAIADKEGISVTDEELGKHIEQTAKARNMAPAKLRAEWQRDGRIDSITYSIRQEKVLNFLVENAKITEVEKLTQQGVPAPGAPMPAHGEEGHVHGPDCDH